MQHFFTTPDSHHQTHFAVPISTGPVFPRSPIFTGPRFPRFQFPPAPPCAAPTCCGGVFFVLRVQRYRVFLNLQIFPGVFLQKNHESALQRTPAPILKSKYLPADTSPQTPNGRPPQMTARCEYLCKDHTYIIYRERQFARSGFFVSKYCVSLCRTMFEYSHKRITR